MFINGDDTCLTYFVVSFVVSDGLAHLSARPSAHDDDQVRFPYIYIYIYIYMRGRHFKIIIHNLFNEHNNICLICWIQSYTLYSNES